MIYLDYSATTPINKEVIKSFEASCEYFGNPNSLHKLGLDAKNLIDSSTEQIQKLLKTDMEVIYTSGSSESNNTVIKGITSKYPNRGKHIITTSFEHSSIVAPLNYLIDKGYTVDFVKTDDNGIVDLNNLEELITDDTILVTIASVNSEIGILQPIEEIAKIVKKHPKCFFHSDMTQSIGKVSINLDNIDFISFSGHKIYGFKGIGCLLKKKSIVIDPLVHGGTSTTIYRSGTPCTQLIVSLSKSLRLVLSNNKYDYVKEVNDYLKQQLKQFDKVVINSNDRCIPHILNFSVLGVKPEVMQHALERYEIYISTQTACSSKSTISKSVLALTNSAERASSSVRVSLSYLTTKTEIDEFIKYFKLCYEELI